MRHSALICLSALLFCSPGTFASEAILTAMPSASVVGRGVLSYAFWDVYEATLYAPDGRFDPAKPVALSITYFFSIDGKVIADKSIQEMRQQGFSDEIKLAAWNAQMKAIFPDVDNGVVLTAVYTPDKQTIFYNGSTAIGSIKGNDFGRLFMGIWLDERTSEPELRRSLLGQS